MKNKRLFLSVFYILIGVVLFAVGSIGGADAFWSGIGGGLIGCGAVRLIQYIKYRTDKNYKEAVDIAANDERNKYISLKAWAWAGYLFVLISAVVTIVLRILKYKETADLIGAGMCLLIFLYAVTYLILRKKY
ncbi:MAG: hypothetical protein MRZ29_06155 [Oscillospiraceae bacterium]|nr:hypothetical protein [Oscillospiraceae bacterium]